MVVFAVNQRCEAVLRVALDALPDIEHGSAGRVDKDALDATQLVEVVNRDAERGEDHHVLRRHRAEIELTVSRLEDLDAHFPQACVHVRVVDDLAHQINAAVRELAARLIRVFHGALDPIAEAEFAGEADRHVPDRQGVILGFHPVHKSAAVVAGELVLDLGPKAETLSEIGTWVGCCHAENYSSRRGSGVGRGHLFAEPPAAGYLLGVIPTWAAPRLCSSTMTLIADVVSPVAESVARASLLRPPALQRGDTIG